MRRILLIVAYDGTKYCGWQLQPNAITVEEVLNRELSRLLKEDIMVIGASRTDSGVHAMGNVAVFDTKTRIPAEKLCYALNHSLPEDIVIQKSFEVAPEFHPRKWDSKKTYEYKIWNADFVQPFNRGYTHFVYHSLDVEAMRQAAQYFLGEHDFTSFCSTKAQVPDHIRTIYSLEVEQEDHLITIRVSGSGFLYNMVRIIAGTLLQVGEHIKKPEDVKAMLAAKNREAAGPTAPAKGLLLVGIEYFPDPEELWKEQAAKEATGEALQKEQAAKEATGEALQKEQAAKEATGEALQKEQAAKEATGEALQKEQAAKEATGEVLQKEQAARKVTEKTR